MAGGTQLDGKVHLVLVRLQHVAVAASPTLSVAPSSFDF
jgi:hypothetical protein